VNTSVQPHIDKIEIVYEDDYIIAINKPNNYLVHQSEYAGNLHEQSVVEFLIDQTGIMFTPIHRLDRKTSGILLMAKEKKYINEFQKLFQKNTIKKTYLAVVRGYSPENGVIDSPIKNEDSEVYKEALTHFKTLQSIELDIAVQPYDKSRYSLIQLEPKTGRMHQLRKHLNKISHPIVGDYKYGDRFHNRNFENNFNWNYMFLHATSIAFKHPFTSKELIIKADFPSDWNDLLQKFNWQTDF